MTLSSVIKDNLYSKSFIPNDLLIKYSYGLLKALNYLDVAFNLYRIKESPIEILNHLIYFLISREMLSYVILDQLNYLSMERKISLIFVQDTIEVLNLYLEQFSIQHP